ncbi:hypothetical protein [Sphingomonas sp.]|uniref:hypothetical protein n=1 Tax=Sphingomonas sp. TaxID=28214 RepID=UPI0025807307|nr:hypothetical protein [Sphingomonas sp.]
MSAADDAAFLRDLAARLFRAGTPAMGFDQHDTDQLYRIARDMAALTQPPETAPVSDPSREVLTAFADSLDAVPFDTASAAFFSLDTTHGHARVLRRAIRELLDRVDTIRPPYKPFWENPDGPQAA